MTHIFLNEVLSWMPVGHFAHVTVDEKPGTTFLISIGVDDIDKTCAKIRKRANVRYLDVYEITGLSGQYQGLAIRCRDL